MSTPKPPILVICGPTATGKTSLALRIATLLPRVNLLSADSRQIYQDLDIVTGKDIPGNLPENIKVFGLNLTLPNQIFNVSDFAKYAQKVIENSLVQNTPLIIVGGTGLYLQAITSNLLTVNIPPNPELRGELEKMDLQTLKDKLQRLNPIKFASLNNSDAHNPRRLIRAIEISISSSSLPDSNSNQNNPVNHPIFHWVGLSQDQENQKENIKKRVLDRLKNGAIREVQTFQKKYPNLKLPLFSSLGIKQIMAFQNQEISLEELITLWTQAENDYARRQMVWFRKQPGIIWYDRSKITNQLVAELAKIINPNA